MRMRAAVLERFGEPLAVQEVELEEPRRGEVPWSSATWPARSTSPPSSPTGSPSTKSTAASS
jgi:hypothetical protein